MSVWLNSWNIQYLSLFCSYFWNAWPPHVEHRLDPRYTWVRWKRKWIKHQARIHAGDRNWIWSDIKAEESKFEGNQVTGCGGFFYTGGFWCAGSGCNSADPANYPKQIVTPDICQAWNASLQNHHQPSLFTKESLSANNQRKKRFVPNKKKHQHTSSWGHCTAEQMGAFSFSFTYYMYLYVLERY